MTRIWLSEMPWAVITFMTGGEQTGADHGSDGRLRYIKDDLSGPKPVQSLEFRTCKGVGVPPGGVTSAARVLT